MKSFFLLLSSLTLTANAAGITERLVQIEEIEKPSLVTITLDEAARNILDQGLIVSTSKNQAVAFYKQELTVQYLPKATITLAPKAADTIPPTTLESIRDGNSSTAFQPVTAPEHVFRFRFAEDITPTTLRLAVATGRVNKITVRTGKTEGSLREVFTDVSSEWLKLPGEKARVVEVRIGVDSGTFRLADISLDSSIPQISFRAVQEEQYRVIFGVPGSNAIYPHDPSINELTAHIAGTLGQSKTVSNLKDDFDGLAPGKDNCPTYWNPKQEDQDGDEVGDACDNCPSIKNTPQRDVDGDGFGNECSDNDKDGQINFYDNCPEVKNPAQEDEDSDDVGNLCDTSDDRFTAHGAVLWVSVALVIGCLLFLAMRVFKSSDAQ